MYIVSFSFSRGGAAKAASRFLEIAKDNLDVVSLSIESDSGSIKYFSHLLKRVISLSVCFLFQRKAGIKCSVNLFSYSPILKKMISEKTSVFNFHWIANDTLSIFSLNFMPRFSVLTLHDEWFYCGVEHYFIVNNDFEKSSYCQGGELDKHISFLHLFAWNKKRVAFKGRGDLIVTCPSVWMKERAERSLVFADCDVRLLYNPVDTSIFSPANKNILVDIEHGINADGRYLVVFGAVGGVKSAVKGFSELNEALKILSRNSDIKGKIKLGIFGGETSGLAELHGFPVHEFGYINDERDLAKIYTAAYVSIVPSKVEAFGQVAAESQSCGTPVVAFNTSGLRDVVIHNETGYLAEPFDPASLAEKIENIINLPQANYIYLCEQARKHVIDNFSYDVIRKKYLSIINEQSAKIHENKVSSGAS